MPPTFRPAGAPTKRQRDRAHDAKRRKDKPWRSWYALAVWQQIRRRQLTAEPYCERHAKRGDTVVATTVNHVEPHRGDWSKFVNGPFESLCDTCHNAEVQREERAAMAGGQDGNGAP